jgi:hypothetical protein
VAVAQVVAAVAAPAGVVVAARVVAVVAAPAAAGKTKQPFLLRPLDFHRVIMGRRGLRGADPVEAFES